MADQFFLGRFFCMLRKYFILFLLSIFLFNNIIPLQYAYAKNRNDSLNLTPPGQLLSQSPKYRPSIIKGLTIYPENPLLFDFIVDPGDSLLGGSALEEEALKMVKYFLASLTVPDDQMWVNLSPLEPDRIVAESLGETTMGRDLLAQDYMLKQITSSLMYPEKELGNKFWQKIYKMAYGRFGVTDIPVSSFNKVWVVPSKAAVYAQENSVFVVRRHLKVMLESDYLSLQDSRKDSGDKLSQQTKDVKEVNDLSEQILKEIIIPELEEEVNYGRHFANLRQIYNTMILAKWYKENLKESLLGQVYADKNKTRGVHSQDAEVKEKIYDQYLAAFKKGVYNIIKDEYDPVAQAPIHRKYFSGGLHGNFPIEKMPYDKAMAAEVNASNGSGPIALTVALVELGKGTNADVAMAASTTVYKTREARSRPFGKLRIASEQVKKLLKPFRVGGKNFSFMDVGEEYMLVGLGKKASNLASGGLGFLGGEFIAKAGEMARMAVAAVTHAYKNRRKPNGEYEPIDYSQMPNTVALDVETTGGIIKKFQFPTHFKGGWYDEGPYGKEYVTSSYVVDNAGIPAFLLNLENEPHYHHLYDNFNRDEKRKIQYGLNARLLIEFIKNTGEAPDVLRLNEGHMAFVYPAIINDITHHRENGTTSIFEGIKIIFTNHTPEWAGIPAEGNIDYLRNLVGSDLVPDYMLTDGHFNSLEAMVQCALNFDPKETGVELIINAVSREHYEVLTKLLLKRFPDAHKVITYIQNGSRAESWLSDRLKAAIEEHGLHGITGEMLVDIMEQDKLDLNDGLRGIYGENAPQFDLELLKKRPILAFLRRWVEYKEAKAILPLIEWIVGDKDKNYWHPEILDWSVLEKDPDALEKALQEAKWVESPGMEMLVIAGGKKQGELVGEQWLKEFKDLSQKEGVRGRLMIIEDTGFSIMKLIAAASQFLYNVPDPTREASGTSQQRWGLNGKIVIAIIRAGMGAQIKHRKSGLLVNPFPKKSQDELIEDFDPSHPQKIAHMREQFRARAQPLVAGDLQEVANLYYHDRGKLAKMMLASFRYSHDTVEMKRQVRQYEALAFSLMNGKGKEGFEEMREAMALQGLFEKIYRWHPELSEIGATSEDLRSFLPEVWSPLDDIELGESRLTQIMALSHDVFVRDILHPNGMEYDFGKQKWFPTEATFGDSYLDIGKPEEMEEDHAIMINAQKGTDGYGGINLDPRLVDVEVERDKNGVPLSVIHQPIEKMNIEGFMPFVIDARAMGVLLKK